MFALFWPIVHVDPVNTLFLNLVSGWKNWKCHPCALGWTANLYTLCIDEAIGPPLDLWTPQRLITTTRTTTMADYMLVFMLQKIWSLLELLGKILCCSATTLSEKVWSSSCCVRFLRLLSACIQCTSFMHMLHLFFSIFNQIQHLDLEYELKHVESFTMDLFGCKYTWNDAAEDGGKLLFWFVCSWT